MIEVSLNDGDEGELFTEKLKIVQTFEKSHYLLLISVFSKIAQNCEEAE